MLTKTSFRPASQKEYSPTLRSDLLTNWKMLSHGASEPDGVPQISQNVDTKKDEDVMFFSKLDLLPVLALNICAIRSSNRRMFNTKYIRIYYLWMTCAENPPPSLLKQDGLCTQGLYCRNQSWEIETGGGVCENVSASWFDTLKKKGWKNCGSWLVELFMFHSIERQEVLSPV